MLFGSSEALNLADLRMTLASMCRRSSRQYLFTTAGEVNCTNHEAEWNTSKCIALKAALGRLTLVAFQQVIRTPFRMIHFTDDVDIILPKSQCLASAKEICPPKPPNKMGSTLGSPRHDAPWFQDKVWGANTPVGYHHNGRNKCQHATKPQVEWIKWIRIKAYQSHPGRLRLPWLTDISHGQVGWDECGCYGHPSHHGSPNQMGIWIPIFMDYPTKTVLINPTFDWSWLLSHYIDQPRISAATRRKIT